MDLERWWVLSSNRMKLFQGRSFRVNVYSLLRYPFNTLNPLNEWFLWKQSSVFLKWIPRNGSREVVFFIFFRDCRWIAGWVLMLKCSWKFGSLSNGCYWIILYWGFSEEWGFSEGNAISCNDCSHIIPIPAQYTRGNAPSVTLLSLSWNITAVKETHIIRASTI